MRRTVVPDSTVIFWSGPSISTLPGRGREGGREGGREEGRERGGGGRDEGRREGREVHTYQYAVHCHVSSLTDSKDTHQMY